MSPPEVGVLLPVRLETRFVPPAGRGRWHLRVRVVPDAVSITMHDPLPSAAELDAVEAMWREAGGKNLESERGRQAWRRLAARVGAERAAWLARTFPPVQRPDGEIVVERPPTTRDGLREPRLVGLPPTIELWLARGGRPPEPAAALTVLADEIGLDFVDPDTSAEDWWSSFEEARRVGLAADIDLGADRPVDIDVLYAVGAGGADPGPLLAAHADSGRLGVIEPGTPTSTVDGNPAARLAEDADEWRRLVGLDGATQPATRAVSEAVGAATSGPVRAVPGGEADHGPLNRALVSVLWPGLWGHSLGNVWGYGKPVDALGLWATDNVVPEGPLPALRIGNQPYGLLPATALSRWRGASGDPTVEDTLVPLVRQLLLRWAAAAEAAHAAIADPFDRVVRTPASSSYAWRWMVPLGVAQAVSYRFGDAVRAADLGSWWERTAGAAPRLGVLAQPAQRLASIGWAQEVGLKLVQPDDLPAGTNLRQALRLLGRASVGELLGASPPSGAPQPPAWGTSLLTELARHSLVASAAVVARSAANQPRALVEPDAVDGATPTQLETWASRFRPPDLARRSDPAVALHRRAVAGLDVLAERSADELERALRAALDTATHRIDPWVTAVAWRRMQSLAAAPRFLGVYGWVDAPRPRAAASAAQYLLAPSAPQAAVAALIRDRALRDAEADRWKLELTSDAIRGAVQLSDDVRRGSHPAEALGRAVEQIAARPQTVDRLRETFPLLPFLVRREHRLRRVCDGVAVLEAVVSQPQRLTDLGVRPAQLEALRRLAAAVDALGDLHVAEGMHAFVEGRPAAAGAVMAAAAGLATPPTLEVVRTRREGRSVACVALVVLADRPSPTGANATPAALADPAVAAYLDERSGDPAGRDWTWTRVDDAGEAVGTVTLTAARLRPSDTIGLGAGNLAQAVCDITGAARLEPPLVSGHRRARALAGAIAGLPATGADVLDDAELIPAQAGSGAVADELRGRYLAVRAAAVDAHRSLTLAASPNSTLAARRAALRTAARWGVTPLATAEHDPAAREAELGERVQRAAEVLAGRLAASPGEEDVAELTVERIAELIVALVAPEGPLPILARLPVAAFSQLAADSSGNVPRLDPDWLETVAAVRPQLARFEAAQLDERLRSGGRPMSAWTNRPGDPWQTEAAVTPDGIPQASRLVAAFAPPGVLPARPRPNSPGRVAVALVDRFAENVPATEHASAIGFSHDLPSARAPQAIILAVPPVVDSPLAPDVLVDIVAETRLLARARGAGPNAGGPAAGTLHLATIAASGRGAAQLERS